MYEKVSSTMNFVEREKKTEQFWRENKIFEKSIESRKEGKTYTFAMNGQTGKMAGDLPVDKARCRKWFWGLTAAVGAAAFALSYLLWLL